MLEISKAEAEEIRKEFRNIKISKTMRNHSKAKRGKRYVPAYGYILNFLNKKYNTKIIDE